MRKIIILIFVMILFSFSVYATFDVASDANLVGWWKLDNGDFTDSSLHNNDLDEKGTSSIGTCTGFDGTASGGADLEFDNSNALVLGPNQQTGLKRTSTDTDFTICGWFKTERAPATGYYPVMYSVTSNTTHNAEWTMSIYTGPADDFIIYSDCNAEVLTRLTANDVSSVFKANEWVHICIMLRLCNRWNFYNEHYL